MSPDAIELYPLILAEGPRFTHLVKSYRQIGPDRVTARVAKELRLWAERGRINTDDPNRIAAQFLDTVRGELHLRAMAGLRPDVGEYRPIGREDSAEEAIRGGTTRTLLAQTPMPTFISR